MFNVFKTHVYVALISPIIATGTWMKERKVELVSELCKYVCDWACMQKKLDKLRKPLDLWFRRE